MADVIIVLARGIENDGSLPPDPIARVRKGVELYQAGAAPVMIMSGSWTYHLDIDPPRTEAAAMKAYAISLGMPANVIIEEIESKDTLGNAYFTKVDFCEPRGWRDIIVVTSDDHLKRSKYIFTKVFGPGYSIRYETSQRVLSDEQYNKEQQHEIKSLAVLRRWIGSFKDGDDASVWQLMSTKHPGYATNPEVSREQLMRAVNSEDIYPDSP